MTVLRELVAKLGFQVDDAGFRKATEGVEKIKKGMEHASESSSKLAEGLVSIVEAVGFEETIRKCLELADGVETTGAVLDAVFGEEGSKAVRAWSDATGEWLGRSKNDLAAAAAGIGSLIQPMVGSSEKAQQMSEKLTEMGVDMASVFGGSDADAIDALKGGMAGMGRSLKRYGIVLDDATLQEYAHTKGIQKKISEMTVAEKAELTYGFLIARTSKYQGDAHRNADSYANSTKRLGAQIKTLGTDIGKTLLPAAAKLATGLGKLVANFAEVAAKSHIVETTLAVLTAGFVVMKWEAIAAFAVPLLSILAIAAALDELYTLFTGGKTVIGDWLDDAFGEGTTDTVVNGIKGMVASFKQFYDDMPDLQGVFELLDGTLRNFGKTLDRIRTKLLDFGLNQITAPMRNTVNLAIGAMNAMGGDGKGGKIPLIGEFGTKRAGRSIDGKEMGVVDEIVQDRNDLADQVRRGVEERARARAAREYAKHQFRMPGDQATGGMGELGAGGALLAPTPFAPGEAGYGVLAPRDDSNDIRHGQARMRVPAGGGEQHVTNNTVNIGPTTIHAGNGNAADTARRVEQKNNAHLRRTQEQLEKHGGG